MSFSRFRQKHPKILNIARWYSRLLILVSLDWVPLVIFFFSFPCPDLTYCIVCQFVRGHFITFYRNVTCVFFKFLSKFTNIWDFYIGFIWSNISSTSGLITTFFILSSASNRFLFFLPSTSEMYLVHYICYSLIDVVNGGYVI